jgi:thiol-disulfide isomerase/thioredoxin
MGFQQQFLIIGVLSASVWQAGRMPAAAADPTPESALTGYKPVQPLVEYTTPPKTDFPRCTMKPEKQGGVAAWILRDPQGEILRRFADSNGDNQVDTWCYYLEGVEVYRDIDSDFNTSADQYRWFNTGGTRWGIDDNEDRKIDAWRVISPHEVAEQLVLAVKNKDQARFELLLATPRELGELGLGSERAKSLAESIKAASAGFAKFAAEQKVATAQSRYVDFGSSRPATIPTGTNGSTKDMTVYENASALVQTDGKHEQIYLGTLVSAGGAWKLIGLPTIGSETQGPGIAMNPNSPGGNVPTTAGAPTEEMQRLMAELQQLDANAGTLSPDKLAANIDQRAEKLLKLAEVTPDPELREQWYRQLTDMLGAAVQGSDYRPGLEKLEQLQKRLVESRADEELISHVVFQRMWGEYVDSQKQPGADAAKLQEKWLADLEAFVKQHPKSTDAAEALLQLGMYQEFVGKTDEAQKWYKQLVGGFPTAAPAVKAQSAIARINSVGKPIRLKGKDVDGKAVDLASYRNKVVLVQYWSTWCEPCKEDMILLKDFHAKNAAGGKFDIIGVCLDGSAGQVKSFLAQNRFPWKQILETGGLDGPLANEMGVMTLPLMLLIDQQGNVVNNNVHVAELDAAVAKLMKEVSSQGGNQKR